MSFKIAVGEHDGQIVNLRTIIACSEKVRKMEDMPKLVLMHGYCGSGALFFRIFKKLADHVCLILVDIPGMGGSD